MILDSRSWNKQNHMKTSVPTRSNWQTVFWCLQIRVGDAVEKVRRCALGCNWCTMVHLEYLELWISMIFAFADGSCLGPPRTKGLVFVVLDSVLLQQRQDAAKRQIENLWECFCAGFAWAKTTQCQEDWTTEGKAEFCLFLFLVYFFRRMEYCHVIRCTMSCMCPGSSAWTAGRGPSGRGAECHCGLGSCGQSWAFLSARHCWYCCYHNMIRHMPQPFELFEPFLRQLWWDCRSHLKRKVKSRQMAVLTWSSVAACTSVPIPSKISFA